LLDQQASIQQLLSYYMGKNTQERQEFIIENLHVEIDVEEELVK
jgi:topoisomerase-4 subunit B